MNYLIVIDMQNDFITGNLKNESAHRIVKPIADFVKAFDGQVICTRDTHYKDYLDTIEGHWLPVEHCIEDTWGWRIVDEIWDSLHHPDTVVNKYSFGYKYWYEYLTDTCANEIMPNSIIYICGTCTDICVISNAIMLRSLFPNNRIIVIDDLCAGTTVENHNRALDAMSMCQIEIVSTREF